MKKVLDYYTEQGIRTKVKKGAFKNFPDDIPGIAKIIQGLLIHPNYTQKLYNLNLPEKRIKDRYLRTLQESLDKIIELNKKPLTEYREPKDRIVNICKHFAMFMCSVLREKGIPARCRCGFATYFHNAQFDDHRICEYRNKKTKKWSRVDAQIGDIEILKYNLNRNQINFTDIPKDIFFTGGVLRKLYREGVLSGDLCGFFAQEGLHGERYIRGNMLRDFFALNKIEYSYQEESELMSPNYKPTEKELLLLDKIADLTIHADEKFDELQKLYTEHLEIRP